jgi:CheY-like chemotaxis protein
MQSTTTPSLEHRRVSPSSPLVLLVEDHEDTRELLRFVAEARGCRVVEAVDGEEAVRMALISNPDVILMDTNLPRVDGLTATQRIRQLDGLTDVPIIFISGHARPEDQAKALAIGANAYFVKPIKLSDLEFALELEIAKKGNQPPGQ